MKLNCSSLIKSGRMYVDELCSQQNAKQMNLFQFDFIKQNTLFYKTVLIAINFLLEF